MSRRRILIVDDEPGMLRAVRRVLERSYDLLCVSSADEALAACEEREPDLAILDIRMPEMDGFELTATLKRRYPEMDVILMTGSVGEMDRKLVRAIRQRAFYFIQKPFDREVLQTLVERCLELRGLAETNRDHVRHLEGVLSEARAFQLSLFPPAERSIAAARLFARHVSCDELCGDLYDHAAIGTDKLSFLIADVSGHGASAAMLTGVVKSAFQSCHREDFTPERVVERIATGIRTFRSNRFVTLICGVLDTASGRLEYVNAGHPPGILYRRDGVSWLQPTGPLVSPVLDRARWSRESVAFDRGARLLLYTDGLVEAPGEEGDFGTERVVSRVGPAADGRELIETLLGDLDGFMKGRRRIDDLTLMVLER